MTRRQVLPWQENELKDKAACCAPPYQFVFFGLGRPASCVDGLGLKSKAIFPGMIDIESDDGTDLRPPRLFLWSSVADSFFQLLLASKVPAVAH